MIPAINSALAGLQAASQKFEDAAVEIVRGGAPPTFGVQTGSSGPALLDGQVGLIDLEDATLQFNASAKLMGAVTRTHGRFLDIMA